MDGTENLTGVQEMNMEFGNCLFQIIQMDPHPFNMVPK